MWQHLLELPPAMWLALPSTLPFAQCMKRPQDAMYKSAIRVGANEVWSSSGRKICEGFIFEPVGGRAPSVMSR
jgi:hypothetical protein